MKRALLAISITCSACAAKPQIPPTELVMTTIGQGSECLVTLDGQKFVTERLESAALTERLRQLRGRKVVLQILDDAPYRCVGSAIITLQRANATFRVPQLSGAAPQADSCALVTKNARLIMQTYDKDRDGKLNPDEWKSIGERLDAMARQTNRETGSQGGNDNLKQVEARDENHDGYIELNELAVVPTSDPLKWKSCL